MEVRARKPTGTQSPSGDGAINAPLALIDALRDLHLASHSIERLAFELFRLAAFRPATIAVTPAQCAVLVGRSDARSARNWLDELEAAGLVKILDRDRRRGTYTLAVFDPRQVGDVRAAEIDPQQELEFEPATIELDGNRAETCAHALPPGGKLRACVSAESCAHAFPPNSEVLARPESCAAISAAARGEYENRHGDCDIGHRELDLYQDMDIGHRTCPKESPSELQAPRESPFAGAVSAALDRFSPAAVERQKREIAGEIRHVVSDPELRAGPVFRVAAAIVDGRFAREELERIFCKLAELRRSGALASGGAFFVGCAKRRFSELGIPWDHPP